MVKSETIYSPQQYLLEITDTCYIIQGTDDIEFIEEVLNMHGFTLWNYPLSEIEHIVENNLNVVLVECMVENSQTNELEHQYRWFEVPEDFKEEI